MSSECKRFAHVILFQCPQCRGPLASAFSSSNEDMENLDGGQFSAVCRCGWIGSGSDLSPVKQSVQPWETVCDSPAPVKPASLSEYIKNPKDWLFRVAKEIATFAENA
jgi:hypothetical protein